MARYDITHACGHEAVHQIYGTDVHGERAEQAARLARRACRDCRTARAQARDAEAAAQARGPDAADGLPELSGSDKQKSWGTRVRRERLEAVQDYLAAELGAAAAARIRPLTLELARHQGAAGWWIDYRAEKGSWVWRALLEHVEPAEAERILAQAERASQETETEEGP